MFQPRVLYSTFTAVWIGDLLILELLHFSLTQKMLLPGSGKIASPKKKTTPPPKKQENRKKRSLSEANQPPSNDISSAKLVSGSSEARKDISVASGSQKVGTPRKVTPVDSTASRLESKNDHGNEDGYGKLPASQKYSLRAEHRQKRSLLKQEKVGLYNTTPSSSKHNFQQGSIFVAPLHTEARPTHGTPAEQELECRNNRGDLIFTKHRKMVVIGLYDTHYTCLPIFTFNGTGIHSRTAKDEFVCIRDHRDSGYFTNPGPHYYLETQNLTGSLISSQAVVHITYAHSRDYSLRGYRYEGRLTNRATKQLLRLYNRWAPVYSLVEEKGSGQGPKPGAAGAAKPEGVGAAAADQAWRAKLPGQDMKAGIEDTLSEAEDSLTGHGKMRSTVSAECKALFDSMFFGMSLLQRVGNSQDDLIYILEDALRPFYV
jgi:hypothetical protein